MSNLVFEILLRLAKAGIALVLGLVLYGLLVGVLAKFGRGARGVRGGSLEIVALVTQYACDLGGQCFIQQLDHRLAVGRIAGRNDAFFNVLPLALAHGLKIGWRRVGLGYEFQYGRFHIMRLSKVMGITRAVVM